VPNYFAFLLTRERVKNNGILKLITVKIRWAPTEENKTDDNSFEDQDGEENKNAPSSNKQAGKDESKWQLKFDYVTSLAPKIENFRAEKQKPTYLNVIEAAAVEDDGFDDCDSDGA